MQEFNPGPQFQENVEAILHFPEGNTSAQIKAYSGGRLYSEIGSMWQKAYGSIAGTTLEDTVPIIDKTCRDMFSKIKLLVAEARAADSVEKKIEVQKCYQTAAALLAKIETIHAVYQQRYAGGDKKGIVMLEQTRSSLKNALEQLRQQANWVAAPLEPPLNEGVFFKIEVDPEEKAKTSELIREIDAGIEKNKTQLQELMALIAFKDNFAIGVYEDMASFYEGLPDDQESAKPIIQAKISEIQGQIAGLNASNDPDKKAKLYTLEKEIHVGLEKMERYKGSSWSQEISANREVWRRTATQTKSHDRERAAIEETRVKIQAALEKKDRL